MIIVGIDEVGRGCWAGPLVAGAAILKQPIAELKDSKQLSKPQRESLVEVIRQQAIAFGLGWVWPAEVDELGLTVANGLAMQRALAQIKVAYDEIIIDGNHNYLMNQPKARVVVKADATVPAVSAASILAKVARDNYMAYMAAVFPEYGFESHVGYGTAQHRQSLRRFGVTKLHRQSFKPVYNLAV